MESTVPAAPLYRSLSVAGHVEPTSDAVRPGWVARAAKRVLDLGVALPSLLVLLPLTLVLIVVIRLDSPGPAVFRQRRVGRHGAAITVWKLRSMHVDAEDRLIVDPALRDRYVRNGFKLTIADDPRVTRIGRWLRATSLDEVPQLWNVVTGSMSVVGPRPVLSDELVKLYGDDADTYTSVRPGLTGLWQVTGRSHVAGRSRVALDLEYVARWSIATDLKILCRTIPAVVTRRGAL